MICVSIAQESRRFALADMHNAGTLCDLIELRLDRFEKAPDVKELITGKTHPVIMSCRRSKDGGEWQASEEERLALLRQCIICKADYVEIDLDAADSIRKYPPSQRVIAYTNFHETPADIDDIYADAQTKSPDIIKLMTLTRTPEEAWPLVQILARPPVPTVVVGLGKAGLMLTVLGKKMGSPWTYAALERGMEAYPGQPTINDLKNIYHYEEIERGTPFVGVTGFDDLQRVIAACLNAVFRENKLPHRCLPLGIGDIQLFRKVMGAVHLAAAVIDPDHQGAVMEIAQAHDAECEAAHAADLLMHQDKTWHAYNLFGRAAAAVLEATLKADGGGDKPLEGRHVLVVGSNALAANMAHAVRRLGGLVVLAARDRKAAHEIAKTLDARFIPFEALYTTMHHVLIICSEERQPTAVKTEHPEPVIHPAHFSHQLTVMDLTSLPRRSPLLLEAAERGCKTVSPRRLTLAYLQLLGRAIAGKDASIQPIKEVLRNMSEEEGEE
jgi:3-dehydroquinate dehydratase/shikimate dehydrogenase